MQLKGESQQQDYSAFLPQHLVLPRREDHICALSEVVIHNRRAGRLVRGAENGSPVASLLLQGERHLGPALRGLCRGQLEQG